MRRFLTALFALLILAGLAVGGVFLWAQSVYQSPGPLAEAKTLVIEKGTGLAAIAERLQAEGVIADARIFIAAARLRELSVKAGEYAFPPAISMAAALDLLGRGETVVRRLTVAEGLTTAQVLALVREAEGLTGEITLSPAEGELLPETYHYAWGDSRDSVVERMRKAMRQALDEAWAARPEGYPLSKQQVLTLASIVEKETALPAERPLVASVFLNRLEAGMKLQSDPTVIYGLVNGQGPLDRPLTRDDLAKPTPYNTYAIPGLPPGPICNVGKAALAATINPPATKHLYFVADGNGGHAFASTLSEHNRNVARWRQIERDRGATR